MKEKILKPIIGFFSNRLLMLLVLVCGLFYILAVELFDLQIVNGEKHVAALSANIARPLELSAQRGNIYDRYGRPLAVNQFAYSVMIDPSITMQGTELNLVIHNFMGVLSENGEDYVDDLPLSLTRPYEFIFPNDDEKKKQARWVTDMGIVKELSEGYDVTAEEAYEELVEKFIISSDYPDTSYLGNNITDDDLRKIISIRSKMWLVRYYGYNPIEIASDVGMNTVTKIEENAEKYKGLGIEKSAARYYPEGEYMAHIIGYVGRISSDEYDTYVTERKYATSDMVGKTGIELAFEDNLRGTNGELTVIVNTAGRKVSEVEGSRVEPKQGDKIFLTIDAAFQKECYELTIEMLKEVILGRLTATDPKVDPLTAGDILSSMVEANHLSPRDIFESIEGTAGRTVMEYVLATDPQANVDSNESRLEVNRIIAEGVEEGYISLQTILILMIEQGLISGDDYYVERIKNNWISPKQVLIEKIENNEITPAMTNVDPSTASLVVADVKTGDILAAVGYPSYDTNEYMNNTNAVFPKLNNDPSRPMYQRAFMEERPPGSTFKMVSAVTGLETGSITENTLIYDEVEFTKAGKPTSSCWNLYGHDSVNVVSALEVSCNYFFFETLYRLGNSKDNNKMNSIAQLNKYMSLFALDEPSGVEIGEAGKARGKSPLNMSSPEFKEVTLAGNINESNEWMDGDTIRTAIGQGLNNYTPAVMCRFITIIANRGDKYDFHLLNRIVTDNEVLEYAPQYSTIGSEISEHTWDLIHMGMRRVVTGQNGTARNIFDGFPIEIAGKTGTAEQINTRPEHTSFGGFAPYDDPEVAIYVMVPFSDAKATSSPATILARRVLEAYFKLDSEIETALPVNELTE